MECAYCGGLVGARELVCPHCGESLLPQQLREEHTTTQAVEPGIDQQAGHVRVPALYMMLFLLVGVGCALVVTVVGVLLRWNTAYLLVPLLVFLPGLLLMLGFVAYSYRKSRKTIGRMLAGEGRVSHWNYSELEWQQVTTRTWKPTTRPNKGYLLFVCVVLLVCLAILGSAKSDSGAFLGAVGVGSLFTLILLQVLVFALIRWLQERQSSRDIYISPSGIILGGWYLDSLSGLYRVEYQAGDLATLRFFIARRGRWSTYTSTIEVLVPSSREEEAQRLISDSKETGV